MCFSITGNSCNLADHKKDQVSSAAEEEVVSSILDKIMPCILASVARFCMYNMPPPYHRWVLDREAHINWSMVTYLLSRQHPFGTTLRFTGPVPADSRQ